MRCQIEKNKEILANEIEKYSQKHISKSVAEYLSICYGAYCALCELPDGEDNFLTSTHAEEGGEYYRAAHTRKDSKAHDSKSVTIMTPAIAEAWTQHMQNEDGSTGPHWTMEQTKQVQSQKGIDCDPVEFWAAMNMVYSDYCKVAKKLNVNNADFYAGMAEAFLDDKDAQPDKLARYYEYVVKH